MIRVTVWYENVQESGEFREDLFSGAPEEMKENMKKWLPKSAEEIKKVYPKGVMGTVVNIWRNARISRLPL